MQYLTHSKKRVQEYVTCSFMDASGNAEMQVVVAG